MPYIADTNPSHYPSLNWSTFQKVDPGSLQVVPNIKFLDQRYGLKGTPEDMSVFYHAYRAQFDHVLQDSAREHFMIHGGIPIVSDEFRQAIEHIEPSHHQFKQVQLYDYWGQPFEGTAFYLMNVVGIIKNANMDWDARRFPFELFPDQKFGHLMRFELKSEFYASDQFAEAWMELNRKGQHMEFRAMNENNVNL